MEKQPLVYDPQKATKHIRHFVLVLAIAIVLTIVFSIWSDVRFFQEMLFIRDLFNIEPNIPLLFLYFLLTSECILMVLEAYYWLKEKWGPNNSSVGVVGSGEFIFIWVLIKLVFKIALVILAVLILPQAMTILTLGLLPAIALIVRAVKLYRLQKLKMEENELETEPSEEEA